MINIEAGKYYKTRDGHKVFIYHIHDIEIAFPIHGCCYIDGVPTIDSWSICGKVSYLSEHPLDIVSEWVEKPKFNWDNIHPIFRYAARDENGDVYVYSIKPTEDDESSRWNIDGYLDQFTVNIPSRCDTERIDFTGDWRDSLVCRDEEGSE